MNQSQRIRNMLEDGKDNRDRGTWPEPTSKQPSLASLEKAMDNDGAVKATDGCRVEPDGVCPHGHPSWLLKLGMI